MKTYPLHQDIFQESVEILKHLEKDLPERLVILNPKDHAIALLQGEENQFYNAHFKTPVRAEDILPEGMTDEHPLKRALDPFVKTYDGDLVVQLAFSHTPPAVAQHLDTLQGSLPSFGEGSVGLAKFANYHEIGHVLEFMNNHRFRDDETFSMQKASHHSEMRADGFAVAYQVFQGADPQQVANDVQRLRLQHLKDFADPIYATEAILKESAEIGRQFQNSKEPLQTMLPKMMQQIDQHVVQKGLSSADLQALTKASEQGEMPFKAPLAAQNLWARIQKTPKAVDNDYSVQDPEHYRDLKLIAAKDPSMTPLVSRLGMSLMTDDYAQTAKAKPHVFARNRERVLTDILQQKDWQQSLSSPTGKEAMKWRAFQLGPMKQEMPAQERLHKTLLLLDTPLDQRSRGDLEAALYVTQHQHPPTASKKQASSQAVGLGR